MREAQLANVGATHEMVEAVGQPPLPTVPHTEMDSAVRNLLNCSHARILGWTSVPVTYDRTNPTSAGVFRISGSADVRGEVRRWSCMLKVLRSPAGLTMPDGIRMPDDVVDTPDSFGYWRREALVHGCGGLPALPSLAAPRCLHVADSGTNTVRLWMEEIVETSDITWDQSRYADAARRLGRFNAAYAGTTPRFSREWCYDGWLRSWLGRPGTGMMRVIRGDGAWDHPIIRHAFNPNTLDRVIELWDSREALLSALETSPQTFCHRDAFRSNLFYRPGADGGEEMVAIDWAFAGLGAIGEEIVPLIAARPVGCTDGLEPWDLEDVVVNAYLRGLRGGGWDGDPATVRFTYGAAAALRYTFATVAEALLDASTPQRREEAEQRRGRCFETVMQRQAKLVAYLLDRADEARALMPSVAAMGTRRTSGRGRMTRVESTHVYR